MPTSFVPQEDQGYLFAALMLPESSSMPRTIKAADQLDRIIRRNQAVEAIGKEIARLLEEKGQLGK